MTSPIAAAAFSARRDGSGIPGSHVPPSCAMSGVGEGGDGAPPGEAGGGLAAPALGSIDEAALGGEVTDAGAAHETIRIAAASSLAGRRGLLVIVGGYLAARPPGQSRDRG